ncbi:MAG: PKD domain-containing protein [Thermomicrobiales bacterium]|nr:PKD domain-containing protein [Thermomicrobiales bacterium]
MTKKRPVSPVRVSFAFAVLLAGALLASLLMPRIAAAAPVLDASATQLEWAATSPDGATVTLDGSLSQIDDPEGTVFTWWLNCTTDPCPGGTELVPNSADALTADVVLGIGEHPITLWALVDDTWYASSEIVVTVSDVAPVANAGADQTVPATGESTNVTLDGSASTGASTYSWALGGDVIGTEASITHAFPFGVHEVTLTVTSAGGQTSTDTVVITVNPVAVAGDDQTIDATSSAGAAVTLNGTGSVGTAWSWQVDEVEIATGITPEPIEFPIGVTEVTLVVTGAVDQTITDTVVVTVNPVADAGEDQTVESTNGTNAQVTLDGTGSIGDLESIVWTIGEDEIGTGAEPTVTLPIGTHEITLTISGPDELSATDTVSVTVEVSDDAPAATLTPVRAAVGATVAFEAVRFPAEADVVITFETEGLDPIHVQTVETDADGEVSGTFILGEVPVGPALVRFTSGDSMAVAAFEVAPRIRVAPAVVQPGGEATVTLTGFGAEETVNIRWRVGASWVMVGTITTDSQGTGTGNVTVPANAQAGLNSVRGDGPSASAQTNAVTVTAPNVTLNPTRTTVNVVVAYSVEGFPANAEVAITWRRPGGSTVAIGTFETTPNGTATGSFRVPATEGGPASRVTFASGDVGVTLPFEVAPRIKVIPAEVSAGQTVEVSLRGFGKGETVRIRWLIDGVWVQIATVTTSNTGSANLTVTVPADVDPGANKVRGDGLQFRAQTNAVTVIPPAD